MRNLFLIIISVFLLENTLQSQEIIIYGENPEYAGDELVFSQYKEYITNELVKIKTCTVDADGKFRVSIKSDEVIEIHLVHGIYDGMLIGEPGREYNIKLPPAEEKSLKELCNPFFEEIGYYIGYTDTIENDLNVKMQEIVREFDLFLSENYEKLIYGKPPRNEVDSFINVINRNYLVGNNPFLEESIKYMEGFLKYISRYYTPSEIGSKYFFNSPIQYNNKSYMNLFNNVFISFFKSFPHENKTENYAPIINDGKGISNLINSVKTNLEIENDSIVELIILKGLFDGFHEGDYLAKEVIPLIDSMIIISEIDKNIEVAKNVKRSVEHLMQGSIAPEFKLYNNTSELVSLSDFRGKYVYLNFVSRQSGASRRELSLIPELQKEFKKKIVFVTISVDEIFSDFLELAVKNKYDWELLSVKNQPEIVKEYKVKSYPTAFLIDPYGRLVLVPAKNPSEGFSNQYYKILNNIN